MFNNKKTPPPHLLISKEATKYHFAVNMLRSYVSERKEGHDDNRQHYSDCLQANEIRMRITVYQICSLSVLL